MQIRPKRPCPSLRITCFLAEHARIASHEKDPYFHPTLTSLARLEADASPGLTFDAGLRATLAHVRKEIYDRLEALFAFREDDLQVAGTSAQEMAARFLAPERSVGQLAAWHDQDGVEVGRDLETLSLSPALEEALAREQILSADRHLRLSEVPALEAIVDRVQEVLPKADLELVLSGDLTPLTEHVRDPALRAAVAHELKNEVDLGLDDSVRP